MLGLHYKIFTKHKIGEGTWGKVYLGQDIRNGKLVAIKTESKNEDIHLLKTEYTLLALAYSSINKHPHILEPLWYGSDNENNYLITNLLGSSLDSILKKKYGHFSMKLSLFLAIQMIDRIRYYHERNIIHRDLKPSNFLFEYSLDPKEIYLIDFGFAKKYKHGVTHIPFKECKQRLGTARFMSVNAHQKGEQCCIDDMYSIGYIILNFMIGKLPWAGIKESNKQKRYKQIFQIKKNIKLDELVKDVSCEDCTIDCVNCVCRNSLKSYFEYLDNRKFGDEINYDYLIGLFKDAIKAHDYQEKPDLDYDL